MEKRDILYLFYRPLEPIFYPKKVGEDTAIFDIPVDYLIDEYKRNATVLLNHFQAYTVGKTIIVGSYAKDDLCVKDFGDIMTVSRNEEFSHFNNKHAQAAGSLVTMLMELDNYKEIIEYGTFLRDRVNPGLFVYAFSVVIAHRNDLDQITIPQYWQLFPSQFIDANAIRDASRMAHSLNDVSIREPIDIPVDYTGTNGDPEHRLAYWREDIGLGLHHWHWHLVYPTQGPRKIVNKDRRGELFYYFHHQIVARYNIERLCNQLNIAKRLSDFREPIEVAYYPKLDTTLGSQTYPYRPQDMRLKNVRRLRDGIAINVVDMERWSNRIFDAIHTKTASAADGKLTTLDAMTGIDIIGNIVEPNQLSINSKYYGLLHGAGHILISCIHDAQGHYKEPISVMGFTATATRDPVFYQWHSFINDLFLELKDSFDPYTNQELNYPGIEISKVTVVQSSKPTNGTLNTFWRKTSLDLSRGLDFGPTGSVYVRTTHLDHEEFEYSIRVDNRGSSIKQGTVRIFMAPVYDYEGNSLNFEEQRKLMIEMDKFVVTLHPGSNVISRKSSESSLIVPFEQTFRDLNEGRPQSTELDALDRFNFCGCGWPHHLLLPKGTVNGYSMKLFVMISNYEEDKIDQKTPEMSASCKVGVSFCGLKDLKYPDKRSMGYPFDRVAPNAFTLDDFIRPNMKAIDVVITHNDTVKHTS